MQVGFLSQLFNAATLTAKQLQIVCKQINFVMSQSDVASTTWAGFEPQAIDLLTPGVWVLCFASQFSFHHLLKLIGKLISRAYFDNKWDLLGSLERLQKRLDTGDKICFSLYYMVTLTCNGNHWKVRRDQQSKF